VTSVADAVDWSRLEELWTDRNVIVHRGGMIDGRHSATSGRDVGTVIALDPEAVQAIIDEVAAARFALVVCVWVHLEPALAEKLGSTTHAYAESLRAGRWKQAAGLARLQQALAKSAETAADAQVNRWLALEHGHGTDRIASEVEAWDTSDLPPVYELARQLLLNNDATGMEILKGLLANGDITVQDMADWPVFDRMREQPAFAALLGS
jgi:hypothetical protein